MLKFLTLSLLVCFSLADAAPYKSFYDTKLQEFKEMKKPSLVFLGDSLTMRHNWSNLGASNMGIDGDTSAGVLSRMHLVSEAKRVVLMIGVNDILNRTALEQIQKNYKKILNHFAEHQEVFLLTLLPVVDVPQTRAINQDIRSFNRWLKTEVKSHDVQLIDMYPHFLDKQKKGLKDAYTNDGIHLTPQAYKVWENILKKELVSKEG